MRRLRPADVSKSSRSDSDGEASRTRQAKAFKFLRIPYLIRRGYAAGHLPPEVLEERLRGFRQQPQTWNTPAKEMGLMEDGVSDETIFAAMLNSSAKEIKFISLNQRLVKTRIIEVMGNEITPSVEMDDLNVLGSRLLLLA